jgi:hypothetical protein
VADRLPQTGRPVLAAHLAIAVTFFLYFYPVWTALPISESALYVHSGTPPWGPKLWFVNCKADLPPSQPQLWCWN